MARVTPRFNSWPFTFLNQIILKQANVFAEIYDFWGYFTALNKLLETFHCKPGELSCETP